MILLKGALKICSQFTGEHPCLSVTLCHGCSAVNLLYIFRTPFRKNSYGVLVLVILEMKDQSLQVNLIPEGIISTILVSERSCTSDKVDDKSIGATLQSSF